MRVLWVNMVTAVTLSLALAYEPAEQGIMPRPPRGSGGSIVSARELGFVLVVSLLIGWSALALIMLQLVSTYVPFMNPVFGSEPLSIGDWLLPDAFSVGIFLAVEVLKALRRTGDRDATVVNSMQRISSAGLPSSSSG